MSSSSNEFTLLLESLKTDVSVGFWPPYLRPSKGHQYGISIQSFLNLGKTFSRMSCISNITQTWFLARLFVYLSSFISQILDFPYSWLATTWQGGHIASQNNRIFPRRIYMKIELSSQRREMLLFLTANMAAVTSRVNQQLTGFPFLFLMAWHLKHRRNFK